MRRKTPSNRKASLILTVTAVFILLLLATLELSVFGPKRLADERQARRDSPAKLVRPSELDQTQSEPARQIITAFRKEEWRAQPQPDISGFSASADPADIYLSGYLEVQKAESLLGQGDLEAARNAYQRASNIFGAINSSHPEFEPAMVDFRRRKIEEALASLIDKSVPAAKKPQSNANGRQSGASDVPDAVLFASTAPPPTEE